MKSVRITALLLAVLMLFSLASCKKKAEEAPPESTEPVTETTAPETEAPSTEPKFTNPLTGLACDRDLSKQRPVSIMVNNISVSLPQEGIYDADIMFECLAEGGITRLMMLSTDYEKLGKVGSVRSARHYYIDYAEGFNCIFMHAGASYFAADTMNERGTDHLDGLNGTLIYTTNTFFRDPERLNTYASEHTLMIKDGAGIKAGIEQFGYSAEKAAGYEKPMVFADWGETVKPDKEAGHVAFSMSAYQNVDYNYDSKTGEYLRFQYNGEPHMDAANDKQLSFKNIILILTGCDAISGDEKNRINVDTVGSGKGYYITEGGVSEITWKKATHDAVLQYTYADGKTVEMNRGKTMINVVPTYNADTIVFSEAK